MKKRNGFTLIELLAVIVILAIIALIATPIILGIIEDTKKDAFLRSVELVISTTDMDIVNKQFEEQYEYTITEGTISELEIGIKNIEGMNGTVLYNTNGEEIYAIHNGAYCVRKMNTDSKAEVSDYVEGKCIISPVLKESDISSITFNDLEYTYDGTEKKIEVNNLLEGFTVIYENNKGTNVGEYRATAIITGENYRGSIKKEATLKINKASITLTAEDKTSDYGEGFVELTYQVTSGTIYNNDNLNVNLTKETGEEIGTYNITINGEHPNYEITFVNGIYTIILGFANDACFAFSNGKITDYYAYEGNNSSNRACPRDVRIPEKINGVTVTIIGWSAFKEKNITSVELPKNITSIEEYAFQYNKLNGELDLGHLTNLTSIRMNAFLGSSTTNQITSVKLPSSVTSIGDSAFQYNKISGELDFNHLTGLITIGNSAFANNSITNVKLPNSVTNIRMAAFSSNQITSLKLPSSVTSIGQSAFQSNKLSGELDLSYLTGLTSIGKRAFEGSSSTNQITSIKLPSSVTSIGDYAFQHNKLSGELDLSHLIGLTTIGQYTFSGSSSTNQITALKLPSSVTSIGYRAFAYNKLSGELDLSHLTSLKSIEQETFRGSSDGSTNQITALKLPSSVTSIGDYAFQQNKLSGELDLSHLIGLTTIGQYTFSGSSDGSTNQITSLKLPSSVTSIGSNAFRYNKLSGELDISNLTGLTGIANYAFSGNSSTNQLTNIKLPSSITSIEKSAFSNNKLSGDLDLSHLTNLTTIGQEAFEGSSNGNTNQITSLKLPNSVTSIGQYAFAYNKLSGELDISNLTGLTGIANYAFSGNSSTNQLTNIKLPSSITSIGEYAFQGNKLNGELDLSHMTGLTAIENSAFQGSSDGSTNEIASLKLPSSITRIGNYAFRHNKLNGELDLSQLTSLTSIGDYAFGGDEKRSTNQITNLKLSSSVTSIGTNSFFYNALTSVTFYGRSDLTGVTLGTNPWGWASGYGSANIYFVNE